MAEALLRRIDSKNFAAFSATITDQRPHPLAVDVMKEIGIELGAGKSLDELRGQSFDFVITLDAGVQQNYSTLETEIVHWKFENPLTISGTQLAQRRAFQAVRDQIAQRIRLLAIVHTRVEHAVVASLASRSASSVI
jgi:protein-tyrosine-phosphatase